MARHMSVERRAAGLAIVLVAIVGIALAPGAAAQDGTGDERVIVELEADGDATVTTVSTYDLSNEADREAFAALEDRRGNLSDRYAENLRGVAEGVSAETGREMTIRDAEATIEREGDVGIVRLSATWTNLAAVDGDRIVLETPFDDGFAPDRPLVVRAPEGYAIDDTVVEPTAESDREATWSPDQDLSGFQATVTASGGSGDALAPSLVVPILGLVAGGLLAAGRRRRP